MPSRRPPVLLLLPTVAALAACFRSSSGAPGDDSGGDVAIPDGGRTPDSTVADAPEAGAEAAPEAAVDALIDATNDDVVTEAESDVASIDATAEAGPGDAASDTGPEVGLGDAAEAGPDAGSPPGVYIDVTNGHDGAPGDGTPAHPYQTLSKAAAVAAAGETIYAVAGTYPLQIGAVSLANDVGIEAVAAGTVTFGPTSGTSYGITFAGSGFVHGVVMSHAFINVAAGTVNLVGVQFTGLADTGSSNSAGINVSASGHVVVTPGALTSYIGAAVSSFAYVSGGQLDIHGGALESAGANAFDGSALIEVTGTGQLLLDGVAVDNALTSPLLMTGTATATLQNGTTFNASAGHGGSAWSLNVNSGSPTIVLDGATITGSSNIGIYVNGGSSPSLTLRNGSVVQSSTHYGVYFQGGPGSSGSLTLNGARISGNGSSGILLGDSSYAVTMRGTQITNNTGDGLAASLEAGSLVDLGTSTAAGGNAFTGNAAASAVQANVDLSANLSTADLTANAVGNTWDPTANGADGTGHFAAGTTLSAPPTVTGKNVRLTQGGNGSYSLKLVATP